MVLLNTVSRGTRPASRCEMRRTGPTGIATVATGRAHRQSLGSRRIGRDAPRALSQRGAADGAVGRTAPLRRTGGSFGGTCLPPPQSTLSIVILPACV